MMGSAGVAPNVAPGLVVFTKARLRAMPIPPRGKRMYAYDARVRGLCLTKTGTGAMSFSVYRRVRGVPTRVLIGRYPDVTIEQARRKAAELLGQIAAGVDPVESRRAVRDAMTFAELFGHYLETHARPHKRSWREDERQFNRYLKPWRNRKLADIRRADVAALHARLGKTAPFQANRVVALLSVVFNHARRHGWEQPNPAQGVKRFRETSRDRFMDAGELRRFFTALDGYPDPDMRDFFLLLLLTGARRGNVEGLRWADVNLDRGLWRIPGTESKNREPMLVVLAPRAVEVLRGRLARGNGDFVFTGVGKTGHLVEPKKAWAAILKAAGIEDLRVHDLRRTLGSWAAITGASLPVIGRLLGQKSIQATAVYARLTTAPVEAALGTAVGAMLEAAGKNGEIER